ncbi:MAG: hypothetical protein LCH35_13380, partial [Bacteroidetes bacterium]|nr:hypothetical protein [Bacteroidota bacterium]
HNEVHNDIMNYIKNSPNCDEANEFALQFITQSYLNQNLTLDFEASKKSPANIDLSNVQGTTEAEKKFRCVYEKLTQSGGFKNLFLNTFGDNNRINVKFEVSSELPVGNNGRCEMTVAPDGSYNNLIQINSNLLDGSISNIIIAKTILHECIHAYLNIKRMNCNLGSTIPELNNLDLQELISLFYQNFNCHINVNGVPQSQHVFMLDYLTPTFINILNEVKGLLISQNHTQQLNNQVYYYPNSNLSESFNWNDFFYNLSLNGLNNTSAFQTNIQSDSIKYSKYLFYSSLFNMVTKECQ